ncbi:MULTISPECIES: hypothetical protein [unclassified Cyanobium]|uniref:hypothetical protein n=1 Tax=unclassified Cyanobium TaxID=2627006 RepID=UPI0020CF410A|nr:MULTISPECIES: hypothetical protein [unclassified Cyanobium]MCP9833668.1 hypothetical protein [Cyanobium sp. La Preciosa 7G6]MCP9936574.1 hypothetical protein [Cyanobium sp. Aljojuca 7A6]
MTIFLLIVLFGALTAVLLDGDWRTGLMVTLIIGFVQDPLRKITPDQPGYMVGLVLIGFALCGVVLLERAGRFNLRAMFWTVPQFDGWVTIYFSLIALQSLNSFARFGDIRLTAIGAAFYLAPAFGLWVGFQVGCNLPVLKRLLTLYLVGSAVMALTVYISFQGVDHPTLKEVGDGLLITFRHGFSAQGASGFWRTSEIASWQLSAAACIAASMALASQKPTTQFGLLLMAAGFAFLTLLTGRRKAQVLILAFVAVYLLLFSRRASPASKERVIASVLGVAGISYPLYSFFLSENLGENFGEYTNRSLTIQQDLVERFDSQGIGATLRAIEISDGIGMGVGAGASTGGLVRNAARDAIQSVAFVSEGGGGRLILELGIPGMVVLGVILVLLGLVLLRNFRLLKQLPQSTSALLMGLMSFALANVPAFFSAAQLYGDPFVLILMSLSLGSFLAIPSLVSQQQEQWAQWQQHQDQQRQRLLEPRSQPLA